MISVHLASRYTVVGVALAMVLGRNRTELQLEDYYSKVEMKMLDVHLVGLLLIYDLMSMLPALHCHLFSTHNVLNLNFSDNETYVYKNGDGTE